MSNQIKILLKGLVSCLLVLLFGLGGQVRADVHTQALVVVKYGLSPGASSFIPSQTTNDGQKINGIPTDNLGNQLSPMAGIHYHVQQIIPTGSDDAVATENPNPKSYLLLGSPIDMVTDENGVATTNLPDGEYLVTEQANPALDLSQASPPVVVRLHLPNASGTLVKDTVYLYPKSSVDPPEYVNPQSPPDNTGATPPSEASHASKSKAGNASKDNSSDASGDHSNILNPQSPPQNQVSAPTAAKAAKAADEPLLFGFLPRTGAVASLGLSLLGLGMWILVLWYLGRQRKDDKQE